MRVFAALVAATALTTTAAPSSPTVAHSDVPPSAFVALEEDLEELRQILAIPGLSAAVVHDQQVVWSAGFGYADVAGQIEATPDTPYGLASVTKPVAATLVMQLVDEGAIDLDAAITDYGVSVAEGDAVSVRHLLQHTSEGVPGSVHSYNGNRYGLLGGIIEAATGRTYATELGERVLVPLEMTDSALNPLASWDTTSVKGFEAFTLGLGWSDAFGHYPDVYQRLARPYQFDTDHTIIDGMYHLTHSPATGLVASVDDLAKFDIALDQGILMSDATRSEMFGSTVPTRSDRSDQRYGLGWYVQDFEGTRLLWHTGRWPPSTSALYVKAPEAGLTFVVLANTDNLTVPFAGIGGGDVMRSALALTFFRHIVFPIQHAQEIPPIDWAARAGLQQQLAAVDGKAALAHVERELWAFRQAFASSGNLQQAEWLRSVGSRAFPGSHLLQDPSYTWLPGSPQVVSPVMSASSFTRLSLTVLGWAFLALASALTVLVLMARSGVKRPWDWVAWLLSALILGPLAVALYLLEQRRLADEATPRGRVACASLFCIAGYGAAWIAAIAILLSGGDDPQPLMVISALLLPLLVGLFLVRVPLLRRIDDSGAWRLARRGFVFEVMTFVVGVVAMFGMTLYVDNRVISTIPHPTSPFFWAMLSAGALIGFGALVPLHYLLQRRGFTIVSPSEGAVGRGQTGVLHLPTLRDAWWMLLATVAIMVAALVLAAGAFGG